jgi:[acyl-carrier-protein] S-malonyltransferase
MKKILDGSMGREIQISWPPKVPVVSNITARPFESVDEVKSNIVNTLVETVHWSDSLKYVQSQGVQQVLSIGPGKIGKNSENELPGVKTVYLVEPDSLDDLINEPEQS